MSGTTPYTRILHAGQQYVLASDYERLREALERITGFGGQYGSDVDRAAEIARAALAGDELKAEAKRFQGDLEELA